MGKCSGCLLYALCPPPQEISRNQRSLLQYLNPIPTAGENRVQVHTWDVSSCWHRSLCNPSSTFHTRLTCTPTPPPLKWGKGGAVLPGPIGQVPAREGKGGGRVFQQGQARPWQGVGTSQAHRLPGIGWLGPPFLSLFGMRDSTNPSPYSALTRPPPSQG